MNDTDWKMKDHYRTKTEKVACANIGLGLKGRLNQLSASPQALGVDCLLQTPAQSGRLFLPNWTCRLYTFIA